MTEIVDFQVTHAPRRRVCVTLDHREVELNLPDGGAVRLSYRGVLLTNYEHGVQVSERWLPIGNDPTEADDELFIEELRLALLWQTGDSSHASG